MTRVRVVGRSLVAASALLIVAGCDEPPDFAQWPPPVVDAGGIDQPRSVPDARPTADAGGDAMATDAGGDATATDAGGVPNTPDYSFVVLPDTQYYAAGFPQIFLEQTRWIAEHRDDRQIAFVLHTGDIVDADIPEQWNVASDSLHLLDGLVPYVLTAGNHDYRNLADRMGLVNVYFPPEMFAANPWFGGTFESGHIENSFSLFSVGAARWVVIALEFGPRNEALEWADSVLKAFRDRSAIVITHAYLYHDSTRYDQRGPFQFFNPHSYVMMGQSTLSLNDGQEMWQKLILPNRNVKLVFSGHDVSFDDLPPGTAGRLSSMRPDGSVVHQILANYQTCTGAPCEFSTQGSTVNGGNGYLRIVRMSAAAQTISVSTYSPHLGSTLDDPSNRFVLPMN